ncbi:MAG: hypothetical protein AB1725_08095 [Armatimonadota bacterium]
MAYMRDIDYQYAAWPRSAADTRTPSVATLDGSEANQAAHFIGHLIKTRGEAGLLSATVSAAVPG